MDKLTERLAVVATIDPDAYVSGLSYTDAIDMADFNEVMFILALGTAVTTASATLQIMEEAASGTGSGSQAISGKVNVAMTSGSNDSQALIHVRASDLSQGFRYVYGQLLISVAGADLAVVALAGAPRFHPASDYDLASVTQIID